LNPQNQPSDPQSEFDKPPLEPRIDGVHVFNGSVAMLGVCVTIVGVFAALRNRPGEVQTLGDNLLAFDALLFLVSCVLSYTGLRTRSSRRAIRCIHAADAAFLTGLAILVVAGLLLAYELI
jgi:hypothetical protein